MIRAIVLDDEPLALRVLTHFCQQVSFVDLKQTFTRTDEAQQYIAGEGVDLLFLDVNMPYMIGTDFYRAIQAQTGEGATTGAPMVIFTTAYAEYAVEGFALNAVDYLLKPFSFERFVQAVTKANEYFHWQQYSRSGEAAAPDVPSYGNAAMEEYFFVRADYTVYKIALADIMLIEGLDDYLKIYLVSDHHPIVARMTMKALLEKLPESRFIRVHRSFIVPFGRIEGIRNKTIRLAGRDVPIGASYEAALMSRFRP